MNKMNCKFDSFGRENIYVCQVFGYGEAFLIAAGRGGIRGEDRKGVSSDIRIELFNSSYDGTGLNTHRQR